MQLGASHENAGETDQARQKLSVSQAEAENCNLVIGINSQSQTPHVVKWLAELNERMAPTKFVEAAESWRRNRRRNAKD